MSNDTTLGGPGKAFPSTRWSVILATQDSEDPARRDHLSALLQAYWKPVYACVRLGWKKSNEDAKDLTQAFFTHLLQNDGIVRLRPGGGTFRGFLKQALKNFLIDADRAAAVRRPVEPAFSLEAAPDALDRWGPPAPGDSPDRVFDREWLSCVLDASVECLEKELVGGGKETYFKVFRSYLLDPTGEILLPTYASVAARYGIKESDVRNYLNSCRARLREIVQAEIRTYVASEDEVEEELRSLLG